jgi:hypothetical protein
LAAYMRVTDIFKHIVYLFFISVSRTKCPRSLLYCIYDTFLHNFIFNMTRKLRRQVKVAVLWDVSPCSLVDADGRFRGVYILHHWSIDVTNCTVQYSRRQQYLKNRYFIYITELQNKTDRYLFQAHSKLHLKSSVGSVLIF